VSWSPAQLRSRGRALRESQTRVGAVARRTRPSWLADSLFFPLRAVAMVDRDIWRLHSLRTERFYYVAEEVIGRALDIGCGRDNRFVSEFLFGNGLGVDVYPYRGLSPDQVVPDMTQMPFADCSFDSVTFIANINHVPAGKRDEELREAFRCVRPGGNIVVTMGNPVAEVLVHRLIAFYDRWLGTSIDVDSERGMEHDESYFLVDCEIVERLAATGFRHISKRYFWSQWGLNHLFVGWRPTTDGSPR
jgi:SAM-dependent methyltransferase